MYEQRTVTAAASDVIDSTSSSIMTNVKSIDNLVMLCSVYSYSRSTSTKTDSRISNCLYPLLPRVCSKLSLFIVLVLCSGLSLKDSSAISLVFPSWVILRSYTVKFIVTAAILRCCSSCPSGRPQLYSSSERKGKGWSSPKLKERLVSRSSVMRVVLCVTSCRNVRGQPSFYHMA